MAGLDPAIWKSQHAAEFIAGARIKSGHDEPVAARFGSPEQEPREAAPRSPYACHRPRKLRPTRAHPMPDDTAAEPSPAVAALRRELAQARAERDEALARESAMAEVLQVINSSPGDLVPVFDAILEKAIRLCDGVQGTFWMFDGDYMQGVASRGLSAEFTEFLRHPREIHAYERRLIGGERIVQVLDLAADELYRSGDPLVTSAVELGGVRTIIFVALVKDAAPLGSLTIARREVRPFIEKQIALLQNFAAQAVIALENARLITETREALEQQTATAEVLQVINASPGDLAPVFDAILEKAHSLCDADHGALLGYDGEMFRAVATRGMSAPFDEFLRRGFPLLSGRPVDQLLRGEPVHILDLQAAAAESPPELGRLQQQAAEMAGTRTLLMVPLCKESALLGYIAAYRTEIRPFSDKQIALLQSFAAQAVIAMENARLITETREALQRQTATAEVLGVINASPGDLAPVFDAILAKAMQLCQAAFGLLLVPNGKLQRAIAHCALPTALAEYFNRPVPGGVGLVGRLQAGEAAVQVADVTEDEIYRVGSPSRRALVDLGGARTAIAVALRKDGAYLGAFWLYRREVRPFTEKQIALLQSFAAQAVIAMENARLLTETREALDQQTATAEVLQVINSSPGDLAPVFDAILEKAHTLCGVEYGALQLCDGEKFRAVAMRGLPVGFRELLAQPYALEPDNPLRSLLDGGRLVQLPDVLAHHKEAPNPRSQMALDFGIRTMLFLPLRKDSRLMGLISAGRKEVRAFSDQEIALLENFAAQAVIAMENARLLGELRQRNDEIAGWNRELEDRVAAQLGELERVGKLKRFLAPQLAEAIVARGDESVLETHRRDIVVVFCDLRDFTAFAETAEPEEVLDLLREYHGALGPIVSASEGTLDHFSGDGIMVFFNDPVPVADASERAVAMAIGMRGAMAGLQAQWRRQGRRIGFGAGIARGYATLGQIGFAERIDYTAIGTVCNLAARLCAEAKDGQILLSQRVAVAVEEAMPLEAIGELSLKGLREPVAVYNVPWQQS
jgi:class 3 adenylate cyclase